MQIMSITPNYAVQYAWDRVTTRGEGHMGQIRGGVHGGVTAGVLP